MNETLKAANSWWMYLLGVLVVVFILAGCGFFIFRAYKQAKEFGYDRKELNKAVINSAIFSLLPSISILIGVIALSGSLGIPLPWIRLTVIGALHYETIAAKSVMAGFGDIALNNQVLVTTAFVMTLGILTGPLYCLFGFKAYDKKIISKAKVDDEPKEDNVSITSDNLDAEQPKEKKRAFGDILFSSVFISIICAFLAEDMLVFRKSADKISELNYKLYTPTIVVAVAFLSMWLLDIIEKKTKWTWLGNFSIGLSMILGMAAAIIVG